MNLNKKARTTSTSESTARFDFMEMYCLFMVTLGIIGLVIGLLSGNTSLTLFGAAMLAMSTLAFIH